jgi:hypothetical protein
MQTGDQWAARGLFPQPQLRVGGELRRFSDVSTLFTMIFRFSGFYGKSLNVFRKGAL